VTLKDLKLPSTNERITLPLIIDGSILEENLKHIHKNKTWLLKELKKQGFENYNRTVALAELDSFWNLIILKK